MLKLIFNLYIFGTITFGVPMHNTNYFEFIVSTNFTVKLFVEHIIVLNYVRVVNLKDVFLMAIFLLPSRRFACHLKKKITIN